MKRISKWIGMSVLLSVLVLGQSCKKSSNPSAPDAPAATFTFTATPVTPCVNASNTPCASAYTATSTSTSTGTPTSTATTTPTLTSTLAVVSSTATAMSDPSDTPTATLSATPVDTATDTPSPTLTQTGTSTFTLTSTFTPASTATSTTTQTPYCSSPLFIGNQNMSFDGGIGPNQIELHSLSLPVSAVVESLSAFVPSGNCRMALYSDNGGAPGTLIAQTGVVGAVGYTTAAIANTPLPAGNYWVGVQTDSSYIYYSSASGSYYVLGHSWGPFPDSVSGGLSGSGTIPIGGANYCSLGPTSTFTPTSTVMDTPTITATPTFTATDTLSPTSTHTGTPTYTFTRTFSPTVTGTPTPTPTLTFTQTPYCSSPLFIGNNVCGGSCSTGNYAANYMVMYQITLGSSAVVESLSAVASSGSCRMALYSDNGGAPGTLISQSGVVGAAGTGTLATAPIPNTQVPAGKYWVAAQATSGQLWGSFVSGNSLTFYQTWGSFPNAPTGGSSNPYMLMGGAKYCSLAPTPTPTP